MKNNVLLRLFKMLMKNKKHVFLLMFFMLLTALADTVFPLLNKYALDSFVGQNFNNSHLVIFSVFYMVVVLFQSLNIYKFFYHGGKLEMEFGYQLREKAFNKLMNLSFSYFDNNDSGWIVSRVTSDIFRISEIISWDLMDMAYSIFMIIVVGTTMLLVNFKIALIILLVFPLLLLVSYWFCKRIFKEQQEVRKLNSIITGDFSSSIFGNKTSKTLSLADINYEAFIKDSENYRKRSFKANWYQSLYHPLVFGFSSITIGFVLWYGGVLVLDQMLAFSTLVLFIQYISALYNPILMIADILSRLQLALACGERIFSLLDSNIDIVDKEEVVEKYGTILNPKMENYHVLKGDITFNHVSFAYVENEEVLKDFNLVIKENTSVAIVGKTGGGKSTIVNLLCRFYEPTKGEILIDGVNYQDYSLGLLHSNLAYVLQTPHLFYGSIMENVAYGEKDVDKERIIECCKLVNAHDFIIELKDGYDSNVGEGGNRLSSGQKQLISFARALYANRPILILDEAYSFVDSDNEKMVQEAISQLMKNRTSVIIAHRLSTIVDCDNIVVLDQGNILEQGNFDQLMAHNGRFHQLYHQK
ncbi:MAG: ABC transporter ATP-binding protein [Erysipelotrichaceae bacterium]